MTTYLSEILEQIQIAPNMVEIQHLLAYVPNEYLTRYADSFRKCPSGNNELQRRWVNEAIEYYKVDILRDRLTVLRSIPERFHRCTLYGNLIETMHNEKYYPVS